MTPRSSRRAPSPGPVGFGEALEIVRTHVPGPLTVPEETDLAAGAVLDRALTATENLPNADVAARDGYAVRARDLSRATIAAPVTLPIAGTTYAGAEPGRLRRGSAWRILTGAAIPAGADAVVQDEDCKRVDVKVSFHGPIVEGHFVIAEGSDLRRRRTVLNRGARLSPGGVALAAAAGHALVEVRRAPRARILCVGSELVVPGGELRPGQRYSSNGSLLRAWCALHRVAQDQFDVPDDVARIQRHLRSNSGSSFFAWILVGGSGGSERDLVSAALAGLAWEPLFEGVRMTPGKGARFGLLEGRPVFGMPGGPSGCEIAFLELVLPALQAMAGRSDPPFPVLHGIAAADFPPGRGGWTSFHRVTVKFQDDARTAIRPVAARSPLWAIAQTEGIVAVPEGHPGYRKGQAVPFQWVRPAG